jgi:hypothetical protein
LFAGLLALPMLAKADGAGILSGTSFELSRGARPAALGGAYLALADDAEAILWNPAGITALRDIQVSASHLSYVQDINDEFIAFAQPIYGMGAWGLGANYFYTQDQGRDNWGNLTNTFTDFDFSAQVAYAMDFFRHLSGGITYKILRQGYAGSFSMGSGFDLGLQTHDYGMQGLRLGVGAFNLGTPIGLGSQVYQIPLTFKGGFAYALQPGWNVAAEFWHYPVTFVNEGHFGTELAWGRELKTALRAGYVLGPANELGALSGLSAGFGLGWSGLQVDYAFSFQGDFGNDQRLSLTYSFGGY